VSATHPSAEVNPHWLDPAAHLGLLNQAFPGQWTRAAYDWYIARPFAGVASDIVALTEGRHVLAGMALCHREVIIGLADRIRVRVICAAATLPDERGRGHYGRLLGAARQHCIEQGYAALLAFVTRDNISARGLLSRGAHAIPSFYITSTRHARLRKPVRGVRAKVHATFRRPAARPVRIGADLLARAAENGASPSASRAPVAHFYYGCTEDWKRQFLCRTHDVQVIRLAHDCTALLETVGSTDRLQWLACPHGKASRCVAALAKASAAAGQEFFMYTLDPVLAGAARRARLTIRPGYFILWATGQRPSEWHTLVNASWCLQSGDRV